MAMEADFDAIQHLDERVVENQAERSSEILNFIRRQNCNVILMDGQIVGYLAWTPLSFRGSDFINLLVVDPDYRRQRHASALLRDFQSDTKRLKCWTSTNASNSTMRLLLKMHGWVNSGYEENLDPGDPDLFFVYPNEDS